MSFHTDSLAVATETPTPPDVAEVLRGLARATRKSRKAEAYPRRSELLAILADAAVRIDRINARV